MTKRLKVYLLIAFAAACTACTLVGCKIGRPGKEELIAGYDSQITYYSNGGSFNESSTTTVMEIHFKAGDDGVPFFNVTKDTKKYGLKIERAGYDLKGWYEPERYTADDKPDSEFVNVGDIKFVITYTPDANGNIPEEADDGFGNTVTEPVFPLKNDKGGYITDNENDRPMFARMNEDGTLKNEQILESRVTAVPDETKLIAGYDEEENEVNNLTIMRNDELDVCADWERSASVRYNLIITDENGNVLADADKDNPKYYYVTAEDDNGVEQPIAQYKNEDPIDLLAIHGDKATVMDRAPITISGLTFVRTYMNKELTERATTVARPEGKDAIIDVYCRYVVGDWTVITAKKSTETASQYERRIRNMFNGLSNEDNKYLIIDDIDCSGFSEFSLKTSGTTLASANATIVVDGDSPLKISNLGFTCTPKQGITYSIFGAIGEKFTVKGAGLILKDTTITLPRTTDNFKFYAICDSANTAASENVNLTIDTVTVTYYGDSVINNGISESHWLFGDASVGSDAAFLEGFTGIQLVNGDKNSITEVQAQLTED